MDNVTESLTQAHDQLKSLDTTGIGQPHRTTIEAIAQILLKFIPVLLKLFSHATGTPEVTLPVTTDVNASEVEVSTTESKAAGE